MSDPDRQVILAMLRHEIALAISVLGGKGHGEAYMVRSVEDERERAKELTRFDDIYRNGP